MCQVRKAQLEQKYSRSVQRIKRSEIDDAVLTPKRGPRFQLNEERFSQTIVKAEAGRLLLEPEDEDEELGKAY